MCGFISNLRQPCALTSVLLIWADSHSLPWAEGFKCLGPKFQWGLFMLVLNLLPKDFHYNSWHLFGLTLWFSFISWYAPLPWNKKKVNLKYKKHQRVSQSIVTGKVSIFWIQDQQQPAPQVGHHFSQRFCGSGKSSRNHSAGPGLATGQLCDLETSASPLGPSVLSTRWRVRWGDLSHLLALKGSDSMKPMSLSDTKTTSSQEIKGWKTKCTWRSDNIIKGKCFQTGGWAHSHSSIWVL